MDIKTKIFNKNGRFFSVTPSPLPLRLPSLRVIGTLQMLIISGERGGKGARLPPLGQLTQIVLGGGKNTIFEIF